MERKSRLMITNMVLENFKSYAGIQEIGPFHKRFTSIVGPNGSGKSNVIDALLFVFGKRAAQLRLKNVSELIHKSSNFPNLEFARVSVHFQLIYDDQESADNYEVVENSEFVVTRTAMKNNQSKYTIDSSTSSFTEVGAVLRKHGIDLDNNRFLILQGEVEQIAMMKPKGATENDVGLLEYFEDIIGTNQLVPMIEEANKKLEAVNEVRTEKVSRVKIAEKERDNLSGSKQEAEDFMEMERNIQRKKNIQYQVYENTANKNSADMTERQNKISEKLQTEAGKLKEAEVQLKTYEKSYEKDTAEYNATSAELQKHTSEYEGFQRHDVKLQEDMKHSKAQIKKHQASLEKEAKRETECLEESATLKVQIDKYTHAVEEFTRKKSDEETKLDKIMEGLKESTAELREALDAAQSRLAEAEKSVSTQQTEKEVLQNAIELLQARANGNSKQLQTARDKLETLLQEREKAQLRVTSLQGETHSRLSASIASLEETIKRCDAEEEALRSSIAAATRAVEEAKVTLASQQNSKGGSNTVVEKVLAAAKKGGALSKIKGIRGRLGDLATIAPEYDAAISTACGQFDFIVVDTNAAAQACVEFLKENNLGRASFILMDQMEDWIARMARKVTTPEGVPRLFDLIQLSDASLAPAFYSVLRDTLVVPDLDQATRIAYQGNQAVWRVVTQDGNLIDTSGTMSGGGKVVKTGGMRLTTGNSAGRSAHSSASSAAAEEEVTPAMIAQLEQKVVSLQTRLTECREQKANAEKELKDSRKQFKDISTEVEKARLAITRYNEQETDLRSRIADLSQQCTLTPQEQAQLQEQTQRLTELESRMMDISPQQKEVASLQRQIRSIGGPALAAAQQSVDNATKQLVNVSSQLSTKQVEETTARKNAEKASQAREKAQAELTKANEKLAALIAEQKEMENDAMVVVEALEALKERLAAMEEGLKVVTKEYHDLKSQVAKIKTVQVDLNVEAERISGELKESNETAKKYRLYASQVRKQFKEEQAEFQSAIKSVAMPPHPSTVRPATTSEDAMEVVEPQQQEEEALEDLPVYEPAQLEEFDVEEVKREINILEAEKNKLKSSVNMSALLEYLKKDANYKSRLYDLEVITEERNKVRKDFDELRRQRLEAFMAGFGVISLKLKEMYQMITLGGDAELELVDSLDPFSEGIVFSVRPPKKSWKNISNLSGGEKTLSSLALVFALHHYKPTPLYVMDEIDAALDFKNVSIVANYIKDRTKDAQFIIISLRNNMFELADRLVGIYKTHDATKSVTINPKLFEEATSGLKGSSSQSEGVPLGDVTNKVHA